MERRGIRRIGLAALAALVFAASLTTAETRSREPRTFTPVTGVARITDGDTIRIGDARIRFFGVDAPEMRQSCLDPLRHRYACGVAARNALRAHVGGVTVTCNPVDIDQYRRLVARCFARSEDLNRWMVASGWAVAYREFSREYVPDEEQAKAKRLGIWNGEFELPSTWRREERRR